MLVFILGVTKETLVVDLNFTLLVSILNTQLNVLA